MMTTELQQAAQAVLDRWNSPKWEWHKQGPTNELMANLKAAIAQPAQPVQAVAILDKTLEQFFNLVLYGDFMADNPKDLSLALKARAIVFDRAAIAQPAQTLQWTDSKGSTYTFPLAGATQLLADLYAKWPGGLKEIESITRVNIAQPEQPKPPFGDKRKAAMAVYSPPFKYQYGYIYDAQNLMVADNGGINDAQSVEGAIAARVRGWGRLGYLPNGAELQDKIGQMMADALNALYSALPATKVEPTAQPERNFCGRCGKRLGDADHIHTCSFPESKA